MTHNTVTKKWGGYTDLYTTSNNKTKVKELVILPGESISMQKHFKRNEHWFVVEGTATAYSKDTDGNITQKGIFTSHEMFSFLQEEWHKVYNKHKEILKIVEIQYGEECIEDDIERDLA